MKKTLLASAIIAATGAMSVAQAESTLTGSLRYGIDINDDTATINNYGSRIIYKGSNDAGVFGSLELRLDDARNGSVVNRKFEVGMGGDWGKVALGVIDPVFDKAGSIDITWWNNGVGLLSSDEAQGGLRYENAFGGLSLFASVHGFADPVATNPAEPDSEIDRADLALLYSAGPITVGAGVASLVGGEPNSDGMKTALHGGYKFDGGEIMATFGVQDADFDGSTADLEGLNIQVVFGNIFGWYGQEERDAAGAATPSRIGIGYTQQLSDRALIWYELFSDDPDTDEDATTSLNAALKFDF